ncbi:MAG: hypothetical protein JKY48_18530 [Flavobacteriales bacterium]|nr:hypothetical protein [Flavobacteriales bacterium]
MKQNNSKEDNNQWYIIAIAAIVIVAIAFYLYVKRKWKKEEELISAKERESLALKWNKKLEHLINSKQELQKKFKRIFRWSYFGARFLIGVIIVLITVLTGLIFNVTGFLGLIGVGGALIALFSFLYPIVFAKSFNLKDALNFIENKFQNKIYGKYLNIDSQIMNHEEQLKLNDDDLLELNWNIKDLEKQINMKREVVPIFCNGIFESSGFLIELNEKKYLISAGHSFCDWDSEKNEAAKTYLKDDYHFVQNDFIFNIKFKNSIIEFKYDFGYSDAVFHDYAIIQLHEDVRLSCIKIEKEVSISKKQKIIAIDSKTEKTVQHDWEGAPYSKFNHPLTNGDTIAINIGQSSGYNKLGYSGCPIFSDKDEVIGINIMGEKENPNGKVHYIKMEFVINLINTKL